MPSLPLPDPAFDRPWFPGLAARLVGPALAERGMTAEAYRTRRWIEANTADDTPTSLFEDPPPSLIKPYAEMGLEFAAPPGPAAYALLRDAWACLLRAPDAEEAVSALVRSVHLLESPALGYDMSHSDPELPCSIFLSLPIGQPQAALRTAESVLHEAMHLQLTLLEAQVPIVRSSGATLYSPWQHCQRPVSGIVHGLYVFSAIDAYLAGLLSQGHLPDDTMAYAKKRRCEIQKEMDQTRGVGGHEDLTAFGMQFVDGLMRAASSRV